MSVHMTKELDQLKKMILTLSSLVVDNVDRAVKAVDELDRDLAEQVIRDDPRIDTMEVEVEEECLKILALHQPVAIDLRFIVAVLKMNNDLERMGDLATNIANGARLLAGLPRPEAQLNLSAMGLKVKKIVRKSLDALINLDVTLAREVLMDDDTIDAMHREIKKRIRTASEQAPQHTEALLALFSIARRLERIADHATNIAEDVIYMINAEIVRHADADFQTSSAGKVSL
jgi:phosphate transport system protein